MHANRERGGLDITLEVWLQTAAMREAGLPHQRLMASNFRDSYWTVAQLITHHASNGCNLRPGDLFGSGTISSPTPDGYGSLLEITEGGHRAIALETGDVAGALAIADHHHGYSPAFGQMGFRSRVRLLARLGDIPRLIAWYGR